MSGGDRKLKLAYRIALICGGFPLLVGTSIFLLWLITRWEWLISAGFLTIFAGLIAFLIGGIALARSCWLALRTPDRPRRRIWLATLCGAGLLLSNFPAALAISDAAISIITQYSVIVRNDSKQALDSVLVFGGGCNIDFGAIPPGTSARRSFNIRGDGTLEVRIVCRGASHAKTVDEYVTSGLGGHKTILFESDGTISVFDTNAPRPVPAPGKP